MADLEAEQKALERIAVLEVEAAIHEERAEFWCQSAGRLRKKGEALRAQLAEQTEEAEKQRFEWLEAIEILQVEVRKRKVERDEARKFGEDAAAKYNELLSERRILRCAFCDQEYPLGTPSSQHADLTAHVMQCEKHPLRAQLTTAEADRDLYKEACGRHVAQLAEQTEEARWIRRKLSLSYDATTTDVYGEMHVKCSHAHGYETYITAYKCNDKQGEIARLTVALTEQTAEAESQRQAIEILQGEVKTATWAKQEGHVDPITLLDLLWRFFTEASAPATAEALFNINDPLYRAECERACSNFQSLWAKCDDERKAQFYAYMLKHTRHQNRLGYNAKAILQRMFDAEAQLTTQAAEIEGLREDLEWLCRLISDRLESQELLDIATQLFGDAPCNCREAACPHSRTIPMSLESFRSSINEAREAGIGWTMASIRATRTGEQG